VTFLKGGDAAGHDRRRRRALAQVAAAQDDVVGGDRATRLAMDLQSVCRATTRNLGVLGAVINLMTPAGPDSVVASSDELSRRVGELPFTAGEGPCLDAFVQGCPVLIPDLEATARVRWAGYASSALGLGVRAVFSIPLHVGAVKLGVLDVYADRAGVLAEEEMAMMLSFATIGTEMLLDHQGTAVLDTLDGRLDVALDHRAEVHQAQGMVMIDLGVDLAEALVRMRAHAFTRDLALIEVARDIIAGRPLPSGAEA